MRRKRVLWPAMAVVAVLAGPGTQASAQEVELVAPQARQGYYISLGSGAVMNTNNSDEDELGTLVGASFALRAGEMITDWIGAGLRVGGGFANNEEWDAGFGGLQLEVQLVPLSHVALHFGVGAGGYSVTETTPGADEELKGTGGAYYSLGASYDLFPFYDSGSGGFGMTPYVRASVLPGDTFEAYIVVAGLQATWWTGLEKNKLDLPFDEAFTVE